MAAGSMWGPGFTLRSNIGRQQGMSPHPGPQQAASSMLGALLMVKDGLPGKCQQLNPSERA